jgi:hypothetical protein
MGAAISNAFTGCARKVLYCGWAISAAAVVVATQEITRWGNPTTLSTAEQKQLVREQPKQAPRYRGYLYTVTTIPSFTRCFSVDNSRFLVDNYGFLGKNCIPKS